MKRLIVICEGQTEQEFCDKILAPYLMSKNIHLQNPLIKRSGGGIVSWLLLKQEIQNYLRSDSSAFVTTFIDLYGITSAHKFPEWTKSLGIPLIKDRIRSVEQEMRMEVNNERFIPNIVVHEFETILFSDLSAIVNQIDERDLKLNELERILCQYADIELINDGVQTAPSKRLENCITGYDKIVYGNILAESIGLEKIRAKCIKFNEWINRLERIE